MEVDKQMSAKELVSILGLTIKRDDENKLITFLCALSAYTSGSQFNISFNAPSSTGKSYIPLEIAKLFPKEDVLEVGYCSPTAFFHDYGKLDKVKNGYLVDLSRKIVIFLDQPHNLLLQHLRPLLSHDKRELQLKITDKRERGGLRTKNIYLIGYPAVIFCTAGLNVDEQESTRFILLSPQTKQEKIRESIIERVNKDTNSAKYDEGLQNNVDRRMLLERIKLIKGSHTEDVEITNASQVKSEFFRRVKRLQPRHQRDIGRVISLVKVFTLLNCFHRERCGNVLIAKDEDVRNAFELWDSISESQELNLPPYLHQFYKEIILAESADKARNLNGSPADRPALTREEVRVRHLKVYGRTIADWRLRQEILPMLEASGLIMQRADSRDGRKLLIHVVEGSSQRQNYREKHGGVENDEKDGGVGS